MKSLSPCLFNFINNCFPNPQAPLDLHDTHQAQKHLNLVGQHKIELWAASSPLLSPLSSLALESEAKIPIGCARV